AERIARGIARRKATAQREGEAWQGQRPSPAAQPAELPAPPSPPAEERKEAADTAKEEKSEEDSPASPAGPRVKLIERPQWAPLGAGKPALEATEETKGRLLGRHEHHKARAVSAPAGKARAAWAPPLLEAERADPPPQKQDREREEKPKARARGFSPVRESPPGASDSAIEESVDFGDVSDPDPEPVKDFKHKCKQALIASRTGQVQAPPPVARLRAGSAASSSLELEELVSQVQALTHGLSTQSEALRQSEAERQALRAALEASQAKTTELANAVAQLMLAQGQAAQRPNGPSATAAAGNRPSGIMHHMDVMKAVRTPQNLKDRDGWEKFVFQTETYSMPEVLEMSHKATDFLDPDEMSEDTLDRSRKLFAMLASWVQDCPAAAKLSRGIRQQNGFELWRLLFREFAPENHSKALIWRRTLLSPKFPAKEAEFSAALQEWEADLDRYESEYGPSKAIADEDKRAVVITEAPAALRQHLAMHAAVLNSYEAVRDAVVGYLQAKRVWSPSATYAGNTARKDAMDIGKVTAGPSASQIAPAPSAASSVRGAVRTVSKGTSSIRMLRVSEGKGDTKIPGEILAFHNQPGDLLVDTGACTSVRRPDAFKAAVDPTVVESLYSVDDSPLHACGEVRPHLTIGSGQSRQEAQIAFQVVEGITDNILSINRAIDDGASILFSPQDCYIQWPDGSKATFERKGRQFVLPYREKDWASRAHVRIAPVVDLEQEAVEAYAAAEHSSDDDELPAAEAEHPAEEEEAADGDLEEEALVPEAPGPLAAEAPPAPTAAERATHLPFQPWCELCVAGKSKEDPHRRRANADIGVEKTPVIQIDYLGRKGLEHGQYVLNNLTLWLNNLGHDKAVVQHDAENTIGAVAKAWQRHVGAAKLKIRAAPVRSHQSQGSVESANGFVAGQIRTLWADVQERYPELEPTHNVMPWLVKHAAWLISRYHVRGQDRCTPFKLVNGHDYAKPICHFGEVVMAKVPLAESKLARKWLKGIWLGKLEKDDSHVIGTTAGAIAVRSVRRLPSAQLCEAQPLIPDPSPAPPAPRAAGAAAATAWISRGPPRDSAPPGGNSWFFVPLLHAGAGALRSDAAAQWEAHPFFGHLWRGALLDFFCAPPIACEALLHVLQSQQDLARQDGRQLSLSEASLPRTIAAARSASRQRPTVFVLHGLPRAMERPQHLRHHLLGSSLPVTLGNQSNLSSQPAHATLARLLRKSPPASL
ncbi:unnamed protein product, partial [Effrenium voratum]